MNTSLRSPFLAVAFAVTVAAGLSGLSLTGKTQESSASAVCARATWPMIPERCLAGADGGRTVRNVAIRSAGEQPEPMGERFATAFN